MSQGRGLAARSFVWPLLAALALGCRPWLAVHRVDPAIDPRALSQPQGVQAVPVVVQPQPVVVSAAPAPGVGVPLPPLPLVPVSDGEALGPSQATPLLDAALARAQALQSAVVQGPATQAVPSPDSASPAPAQVSLIPPPPAPARPDTAGDQPPAEDPPVEAEVKPLSEAPSKMDPDALPSAADPLTPGGGGSEIGGAPAEPAADSERPLLSDPPAPGEMASEPSGREPSATDAPRALGIAELRLCRKVLGFGRFEPAERDAFRPGAPVLIYCEMTGLTYEPRTEEGEPSFRSVLDSTIEILPGEGGESLWRQHLGTAEDLCRRPRRDYYVNYRVTLPDAATLAPGTYRLRLIQKDTLGGATASGTLTLRIEADRP